MNSMGKDANIKYLGNQSESRSMQSISLERGVEGFTGAGLPSSSDPSAIPEPGQKSFHTIKVGKSLY